MKVAAVRVMSFEQDENLRRREMLSIASNLTNPATGRREVIYFRRVQNVI